MRSFMIPRRLIIFALPSVLALFAFWWAHSTPRVIAQGPPVCVTPPPNMVSWWPGDGNANDIQGSNNGTLQGGAAFVPGKVGQAFSFNGTDAYVRVPDNANLYPGAGSFTVDAWIKTTQMSAGNAVILAHYECANSCPPGGGSVYAIYVNGNGKLLGVLRDSAGTQQNLTGVTVVADGGYHHIALVRDTTNSQMQLYVDGVVDASAPLTVTGTMKDDDSELDPFTIGAIIQGGANHPSQLFQGQVDEVEYFNRVLAASEIQGIFNAGSAGKCRTCAPLLAGMVNWWPGDGNPNDIAGNNHGTPNNGATFGAGMVDQAFSFDGVDDYFSFASQPVANYFSAQWTIEFWANPGATADRPTFGFAGSGGFNTDNPLASYDTALTFGDGAGGYQVLTALPNAPANTWTHYAIVDNGATYAVYVNGGFQYSAAITTNPASAGNRSFLLGQSGFSSIYANFFAGRLDEFTTYNRALSASEIQASFNAGSAGKCKPVANNPPVARCQDVTVSAGLGCQANASIDNGSSDAEDGTALTFSQSPPGPYLQGMTSVMLTVTDSQGATSSCSATVTVVDRTAPVILACATDKTLSVNANCQAAIPNLLSEVIARDNCRRPGMPLLLTRTQSPPAGTLVGLGTTSVTITVADPAGNMSTCTANVTVVDMTPPVITLIGQQIALWPPNHQYETINVSQLVAGASDNCGGDLTASVVIAQVSSDEPEDAPGGGDGNTLNDIVIAPDCQSLQLRAERQGSGNGRVYTITFKVTDAAGNVATATAKVTIPKNQNGAAAIDDGPSYTVIGGCP